MQVFMLIFTAIPPWPGNFTGIEKRTCVSFLSQSENIPIGLTEGLNDVYCDGHVTSPSSIPASQLL